MGLILHPEIIRGRDRYTAVIQSLQHKGAIEEFVAEYGHVIVDDCHHLSGVSARGASRKSGKI